MDSHSGRWHVAASVDRRPAEQLYIPAALSAGKQRTAASRIVAPGVLLGPLRVPLHALITVQTEPIPVYPTCPEKQARAPLSFFDHEAHKPTLEWMAFFYFSLNMFFIIICCSLIFSVH